MDTKLLCLVSGLAAGLVRSLKGYFESSEPFSKKLFYYTLLRTAMQGAFVGYGLNQEPISAFFLVYFSDSLVVNKTLDKIGEKIEGEKTS
jgi:hypothetical protein